MESCHAFVTVHEVWSCVVRFLIHAWPLDSCMIKFCGMLVLRIVDPETDWLAFPRHRLHFHAGRLHDVARIMQACFMVHACVCGGMELHDVL